jgi:hypothetical protein
MTLHVPHIHMLLLLCVLCVHYCIQLLDGVGQMLVMVAAGDHQVLLCYTTLSYTRNTCKETTVFTVLSRPHLDQ